MTGFEPATSAGLA